jgi:molybdopterin converting factor small subunit
VATVRLLAGLRERLGGREIEVDAASVAELLSALVSRGGGEVARILWADPEASALEPHRDLRVLVNGRSIQFLDGIRTPLVPADTVTVHLAGARGWPGG